jgi:hypothetical protein
MYLLFTEAFFTTHADNSTDSCSHGVFFNYEPPTVVSHLELLEKKFKVKVKIILRPTVSRPVSLGIKHPSAAYDQIFVIVRQLRVCLYGAFSLTGGRACRLILLLVLASEVIFWTEFRGTRDHIFFCLKFETSLSVASYDSQGYGGGIRPHLHRGAPRELLL